MRGEFSIDVCLTSLFFERFLGLELVQAGNSPNFLRARSSGLDICVSVQVTEFFLALVPTVHDVLYSPALHPLRHAGTGAASFARRSPSASQPSTLHGPTTNADILERADLSCLQFLAVPGYDCRRLIPSPRHYVRPSLHLPSNCFLSPSRARPSLPSPLHPPSLLVLISLLSFSAHLNAHQHVRLWSLRMWHALPLPVLWDGGILATLWLYLPTDERRTRLFLPAAALAYCVIDFEHFKFSPSEIKMTIGMYKLK
ncbi:hypothetical protein C8J57DRAFT_1519372 [Mycena rebaudengoi]|nr:hypothetical protein C8J57DRAFT_1519372 [Mycena rebaudengoi]